MQPIQRIHRIVGAREGGWADAEEFGEFRVLGRWWWGILLWRILEVVEESSHHVSLLGEDLGEKALVSGGGGGGGLPWGLGLLPSGWLPSPVLTFLLVVTI
jgi:hypothetical protein